MHTTHYTSPVGLYVDRLPEGAVPTLQVSQLTKDDPDWKLYVLMPDGSSIWFRKDQLTVDTNPDDRSRVHVSFEVKLEGELPQEPA